MSHACCFRGVGGCLATHACEHMRVHAQIVLHTRVPTRTRSVYTRAFFASVTYKLHVYTYYNLASYFVSVLVRVFPCRSGIGHQTTRSVERNTEPAAEIKEPVTSECRERLAIILSLSLRELRV